MIGVRGAFSGAIALVLVTLGLGPGGPRPEVSLEAARIVAQRATDADDALASLERALSAALDVARRGAAAIVAGDRSPAQSLQEAADLLAEADALALEAATSVRDLDAARRARDPRIEPLPAGADIGQLASIGAQLSATTEAAETFAEMRRRATNVPAALDAALAALRFSDLDAAGEHLATAIGDQAAVAAWDVDFVALPVWVEATDATLRAVDRLLAAVRAGDTAAAERAAAEFAALGDELVRADRALQITISEGGGSVATAPLSRLAGARQQVAAQRAAVSEVLDPGTR